MRDERSRGSRDARLHFSRRGKGGQPGTVRTYKTPMDCGFVALTVGDAVLSFQPGTSPTEFDLPVSVIRLMYYYSSPARIWGLDPWEKSIGLMRP
jgi:hypothetical protein